MAGDGEDEYYESDPEEAMMSLKMRRREASDDEEEKAAFDDVTHHRTPPGADVISSDDDSDGQGGAGEYDDEEDDVDDVINHRHTPPRADVTSDGQGGAGEYDEEEAVDDVTNHRRNPPGADVITSDVGSDGHGGVEECDHGGDGEGGEEYYDDEREGEGEGEKKENEPFAVPTLGAFYMHDDRFRDNAGARQRKTFGGRRLWESHDDRKWGHDKFEEVNMQERLYEEGRRPSRGYYRGRGKGRGAGRGNVLGNRMRGYDGNDNHNFAPKDVRGRGHRRYQPSTKSKSEAFPPQNSRSGNSSFKPSHAGSGRYAASSANNVAEDEVASAIKVASNLNHASPPFYPSGSSTVVQKKDLPVGNHSRNPNLPSTVVEQDFLAPVSNAVFRGKNITDSMVMDKLRIDDSVPPSSATSANKSPQNHNQVNVVSSLASQVSHRNAAQNQAEATLQVPGQHPGHNLNGASHSSPPKGGKGTVQGAGMGPLMYSGAQVIGSGGNMGGGNGDQKLPAFFPVMQLPAQHPRGIGVPAVGMAFPGYVAQPNGAGNSEMTWLPVLASAAGALGGTYCPPYLPIDGSYHPRPTGKTSALPAPSKDVNYDKQNNEVKPLQRSEVSNDEFSQRQNKPRRYSEMNFTR